MEAWTRYLLTFYFIYLFILVAQLCHSLGNQMEFSPPGSSVHGILQARILEWVAISSSQGSSQSRDQTWVSLIAGRFFTIWCTKELPGRALVEVTVHKQNVPSLARCILDVGISWSWELGPARLILLVYVGQAGEPRDYNSQRSLLPAWIYHPELSLTGAPGTNRLSDFPMYHSGTEGFPQLLHWIGFLCVQHGLVWYPLIYWENRKIESMESLTKWATLHWLGESQLWGGGDQQLLTHHPHS